MWWLVRVIFVPPLLHCYWMTEENVTVTSAAIYVACHADAIFKYIVLSFEAIEKKKNPGFKKKLFGGHTALGITDHPEEKYVFFSTKASHL